MNNMREAIIPKSDQLNSDDLIGRELTIKITGVTVRGGQEQPVAVSYDGDGGKPYKPCKSMCRVMVATWGADASKYVGRSMTLYRDPKVKWAGMEVGGIRISHMSHIEETMTMALTVTRANKKPYVVKPLVVAKDPAPQQSPATARPGGDVPPPVSSASGDGHTDEVISSEQAIANIGKAVDAQTLAMAADLAKSACKNAKDQMAANLAYRKRRAELKAIADEASQ